MKRQRKSKLLSPKEIKAVDTLVAGLVRRRLRIEAAAALVSNTVPHLRYLHDEREMRFFIEQPIRRALREAKGFEQHYRIEPEE